jgi:hypothetical protein
MVVAWAGMATLDSKIAATAELRKLVDTFILSPTRQVLEEGRRLEEN